MTDTVKSLEQRFERDDAGNIIKYLLENYNKKVVFTSSMGVEDQIVTHILAGLDNNADIVTLDTGRLFYESYDLIDKTESRYKIKIKVFFPDFNEVEDMTSKHGVNLFYESIDNRKLCCRIRKITPLKRALSGKELWITGLRSDQSTTRNDLKIVQWDNTNSIIKVNPLIKWTDDEVWDYVHQHDIPYNPLHDKGYPSIGCQPCTRAVEPGEDIRAGRWWWENPETKECGLHKA